MRASASTVAVRVAASTAAAAAEPDGRDAESPRTPPNDPTQLLDRNIPAPLAPAPLLEVTVEEVAVLAYMFAAFGVGLLLGWMLP
jgi:hypothetical protein